MTLRPVQPHSHARCGPVRAGRRGYALPLVILLVFAGAILVTVMIERSSFQDAGVRRQLSRYRGHHLSRGLREVLQSWLRHLQGEPLEDYITSDGRALTIRLEDGSTVEVSLADAQGTALSDPDSAEERLRDVVGRVASRLAIAVGSAELGKFTRAVGPAQVSINSAPLEVLAAVCAGAGDPDRAQAFATEVITARDGQRLDRQGISEAIQRAGVAAESRGGLIDLLTDEPTIWRADITVRSASRPGEPGRPVARYEALVNLARRASGRSLDVSNPFSTFLTWEERPAEPAPGR